jgi:hypothetical protein
MGAEVDALRLPLKKKLAALADLPAHIVLFRGHLARLTTAGQAPLDLDAYSFAGNIEGYGDGASEDDDMGGDLIYPTSPPPSYPQYPTANAMQPFYPPHQPYPSQQFLPPPPWPWFQPLPLPHGQWFLPLPFHRCCHCAPHPQTDRKAIKKTRKARHRLRQRQGPLTSTSHVPLCLALQNCTSIATSMAG